MCGNMCLASLAHQKCDITDLCEDSSVLEVTDKKLALKLLVKLCLTKKTPPDFVPEMTELINPGVIPINSEVLIHLNEDRISKKKTLVLTKSLLGLSVLSVSALRCPQSFDINLAITKLEWIRGWRSICWNSSLNTLRYK